MMFKLSKKDLLLLSLILLSQIHIFFRGMDFDILWILNGIYKSTSKTVFLFVKHLSEFVLIYCLYKPKGINKNIVLMLLIITFFDILHFITLSGFGYEKLKIMISLLVFLIIKTKKHIWGS